MIWLANAFSNSHKYSLFSFSQLPNQPKKFWLKGELLVSALRSCFTIDSYFKLCLSSQWRWGVDCRMEWLVNFIPSQGLIIMLWKALSFCPNGCRKWWLICSTFERWICKWAALWNTSSEWADILHRHHRPRIRMQSLRDNVADLALDCVKAGKAVVEQSFGCYDNGRANINLTSTVHCANIGFCCLRWLHFRRRVIQALT